MVKKTNKLPLSCSSNHRGVAASTFGTPLAVLLAFSWPWPCPVMAIMSDEERLECEWIVYFIGLEEENCPERGQLTLLSTPVPPPLPPSPPPLTHQVVAQLWQSRPTDFYFIEHSMMILETVSYLGVYFCMGFPLRRNQVVNQLVVSVHLTIAHWWRKRSTRAALSWHNRCTLREKAKKEFRQPITFSASPPVVLNARTILTIDVRSTLGRRAGEWTRMAGDWLGARERWRLNYHLSIDDLVEIC